MNRTQMFSPLLLQGEHKVFLWLQTLSQENYCTWNTNIYIFSKRNSSRFFLQHISTLQHVLLLLHWECLIENQFLPMCSPHFFSYCSFLLYWCHFDTSRLCNCNITINMWHKILETNLRSGKINIFCIPRSFLVINVCNQGNTLCSPCISQQNIPKAHRTWTEYKHSISSPLLHQNCSHSPRL
jgi:hypothetical protein